MAEDIEELRRKISRLRELWESGEISDSVYKKLLEEYRERLRDLKERGIGREELLAKPRSKSLNKLWIVMVILVLVNATMGVSMMFRAGYITERVTITTTAHKMITKTITLTVTRTSTPSTQIAILTVTKIITTTPKMMAMVKPSARIRIDGDDSDWRGISPIIAEPERDLSKDNYALGVADIKEVFLTHDEENLYFLIRFWNQVNFNTYPESNETLTSIYVEIYVRERNRPLLVVYIQPVLGELDKYVGADLDEDDNYLEESDRVYEVPLAYMGDNVEFSIPIRLIHNYAKRFTGTSTNRIELKILSWAWRRIDGGGHWIPDMLNRIAYELS